MKVEVENRGEGEKGLDPVEAEWRERERVTSHSFIISHHHILLHLTMHLNDQQSTIHF